MDYIMQWCNDNQGVIAAIGIPVAILLVVVPAIFKLIPKCVKYIREAIKKRKDDAHNAEFKAIVDYLNTHNNIATTKILADALSKSEKDIQVLLSELIGQGIVDSVAANCELSNPNSVWELKRR